MISDEPDEDADALDDEFAIETFLGDALVKPASAQVASDIMDWPPRSATELGLGLEADTLAWFQATYTDWRRQVRAVLRAWMMTNKAQCAPPDRLGLAATAGHGTAGRQGTTAPD